MTYRNIFNVALIGNKIILRKSLESLFVRNMSMYVFQIIVLKLSVTILIRRPFVFGKQERIA